MTRYAVIAYEDTYGGLHGMQNTFITQGELEDVRTEAQESSREVMDSYSNIMDELLDGIDEDDEEACNDAIEGNIAYEIYKIRDDCPLSDKECDNALYNYEKDFIKEWCEPEAL